MSSQELSDVLIVAYVNEMFEEVKAFQKQFGKNNDYNFLIKARKRLYRITNCFNHLNYETGETVEYLELINKEVW